MGDEENNQFPSNFSSSCPKAIQPLLQTYTDSEEEGLSTKPNRVNGMGSHIAEMCLAPA